MPALAPKGSKKPAAKTTPSLADLFRSEENGLLRFAYGLTGRRALAEEIVQDVFLMLHRHWEGVSNPRAWLYRSVKNRSLNLLRDQRELLSRTDQQPEPVSEETPDVEVHRMETAGYLRLIVAELPEEDRELIRLKYDEGLKYREMAEHLGITVGNVGYRLHHILKLLAAKLHQVGVDGPV